MLPDDLAGKLRELQQYDFESSEAEQRFEALLERMREEMLQQFVDAGMVSEPAHGPAFLPAEVADE
jgi:uncharacterized protein with von Willebrand factor type A (vWA) domain